MGDLKLAELDSDEETKGEEGDSVIDLDNDKITAMA